MSRVIINEASQCEGGRGARQEGGLSGMWGGDSSNILRIIVSTVILACSRAVYQLIQDL